MITTKGTEPQIIQNNKITREPHNQGSLVVNIIIPPVDQALYP